MYLIEINEEQEDYSLELTLTTVTCIGRDTKVGRGVGSLAAYLNHYLSASKVYPESEAGHLGRGICHTV